MRLVATASILMTALTFFSLTTHAGNIDLKHQVLAGKWHKSGELIISHEDPQGDTFEVKIEFDLDPKGLMGRILKPFLKGEYLFNFPVEMLYERGYENLKANGPVDLYHEDKVATLKYLKQVDTDDFQGAHKVEIRSKSTVSSRYPNGKWHIHLYYHPGVPSVGIFKSQIFYHGRAGDYNVVSVLKE